MHTAKNYTDNKHEVLSNQLVLHNHEPYTITAIEKQIVNSNC